LPNLTITAPEDVLRWARVRAAEENKSVARLVGEILEGQMHGELGYRAAMRRFLRVKPRRLGRGAYPQREELHERSRTR